MYRAWAKRNKNERMGLTDDRSHPTPNSNPNPNPYRYQALSNFFMASAAGHPFWAYAVRLLPELANPHPNPDPDPHPDPHH